MSPEMWNRIAYALLITGIVFFTVTFILAVKFQLFDQHLKRHMHLLHAQSRTFQKQKKQNDDRR